VLKYLTDGINPMRDGVGEPSDEHKGPRATFDNLCLYGWPRMVQEYIKSEVPRYIVKGVQTACFYGQLEVIITLRGMYHIPIDTTMVYEAKIGDDGPTIAYIQKEAKGRPVTYRKDYL
jgi:hypothetical protein